MTIADYTEKVHRNRLLFNILFQANKALTNSQQLKVADQSPKTTTMKE